MEGNRIHQDLSVVEARRDHLEGETSSYQEVVA